MSHILIVDDEQDFSELVQYRLNDCGYRFRTPPTAPTPWDDPPDLILLDLRLLDLDGLRCAKSSPDTQPP